MKSKSKELNKRIDVPGGVYQTIYLLARRFSTKTYPIQHHKMLLMHRSLFVHVAQNTTQKDRSKCSEKQKQRIE